jgi:anthranilate phosphoribosyltransferase
VAIPLAIQRQIACCLLAAGEVDTLEQGLERLRSA